MRFPFLLRAGVLLLLCVSLAAVASRAAASDIVLYSSDVRIHSGMWARVANTTAAGGEMWTTPDDGWSTVDAPIPAPAHYLEMNFDAEASTTYQIWLRLRGAGDSKWNESVWVQFDQAVTGAGTSLWRIGTSSGLLVNLENCSACGIAGWGWQDNAWWTGQTARVRFATSGRQTLRVQVREDGVSLDQIVLSPVTWFSTAPGALRHDTTIVPKPSSAPAATLVRQPYLQQVTPSSAIVVWATGESGIADVLYTAAGVTRLAPANSRLVPATTTGMGFDYYQHEAKLTALSAMTAYVYTPRLHEIPLSAGDQFVTAPPLGTRTVRFIAFGDSGVGSTEQRQLAARMAADTFDFALHTGDVVYGSAAFTGSASYPQLQAWFFDIYRDWLRTRPIYPSIGNHDEEVNHAGPYRDVFVLPPNGATPSLPDHAERFYSFDYGAAHVVVLDTELAFRDLTRRQAQLQWLEQDLAATTQPWKIAVFHRSPYSAGSHHGSDLAVRAAFAPVFDRHHVALVLSGHEHVYERSIPVRETAEGGPTVYVVTGGGGAKLYPSGSAWWTATSRSAFHYVRGSIGACQLSLEAIGLDGATFDTATLDRCSSSPASASTPYGGTPAALPGHLEAEHFDEGGSGIAYVDTTTGNSGGVFRDTHVDIQATTDVGRGYNVGWIRPGEWLAYTVNVTQGGIATISARVASNGPGGTFHIEVGGVDVSGPMTIPNTGGHQVWTTITRPGVTVPAGHQLLRVVFDATGSTGHFGNLNYLRVE
jgi:acid phosphatase type 7